MSTQKTLGALSAGASKISDRASNQTLKSGGALNKKVNNLVNRTSPVVGQNTKGDLDVGLRVLGSGVSVSNKGDITLGFGGVSITFDPFNADTSNVIDFGLGKVTIETTKNGCTITVTTRIGGKIANQQTRQADDCVEPEPTPTPTPSPTPKPNIDIPEPDPAYRNTSIKPPDPCATSFAWVTYTEYVNLSYDADGGINRYALAGLTDIYHRTVGQCASDWIPPPDNITGGWQTGKLTFPAGTLVTVNGGEPRTYPYDINNEDGDPNTPGSFLSIAVQYFTKGYSQPRTPPPNCSPYKPRISPVKEDECCEDLKDTLEDIYDMLGGEDFFKDGLEIPNHLFIPGGQGETKALTYNALLNLMFRTLDHRTVGEVEVSIKDNNIMKEGDQGLTMKLVNATAATGKILELSQKQDSDLTAVLNLLMRLSWISVQILKVVNIGSEATKTIVSFFAIPVKEKVINVDIPVDPSLGGKIGFDPKKPSEDQLIKILDLDDPQKTISIFDKFMNNSKIPVKVKQFIGDRSGGNYWWLMDKNKK